MRLAVYVAGSSAELDRARRVMAALRMGGVEVVSTWLESIEADGGLTNEGLPGSIRRDRSQACLREVSDADVLLLLVPHGPSGIGCGVELGYAIALRDESPFRSPRLIAAGRTERTVFASLCDEEHPSDGEGIRAVLRLAREAAE